MAFYESFFLWRALFKLADVVDKSMEEYEKAPSRAYMLSSSVKEEVDFSKFENKYFEALKHFLRRYLGADSVTCVQDEDYYMKEGCRNIDAKYFGLRPSFLWNEKKAYLNKYTYDYFEKRYYQVRIYVKKCQEVLKKILVYELGDEKANNMCAEDINSFIGKYVVSSYKQIHGRGTCIDVNRLTDKQDDINAFFCGLKSYPKDKIEYSSECMDNYMYDNGQNSAFAKFLKAYNKEKEEQAKARSTNKSKVITKPQQEAIDIEEMKKKYVDKAEMEQDIEILQLLAVKELPAKNLMLIADAINAGDVARRPLQKAIMERIGRHNNADMKVKIKSNSKLSIMTNNILKEKVVGTSIINHNFNLNIPN